MSRPGDEPPAKRRRVHHKPDPRGHKLAPLPKDAKVEKRPLMRPPLPSPYAGAESQKTIYVGTRTPFMSAAKRVEKLLKLSDKRLVQSATKIAQNDAKRKRRRGNARGEEENDEITAIAETVEAQKRSHAGKQDEAREEVVIKGSGKAIPKVMQLGMWFQERDETYEIRIRTSTASSIDDVTYEKAKVEEKADNDVDMSDVKDTEKPSEKGRSENDKADQGAETETVEESRIRNVSVLEVYVSLR